MLSCELSRLLFLLALRRTCSAMGAEALCLCLECALTCSLHGRCSRADGTKEKEESKCHCASRRSAVVISSSAAPPVARWTPTGRGFAMVRPAVSLLAITRVKEAPGLDVLEPVVSSPPFAPLALALLCSFSLASPPSSAQPSSTVAACCPQLSARGCQTTTPTPRCSAPLTSTPPTVPAWVRQVSQRWRAAGTGSWQKAAASVVSLRGVAAAAAAACCNRFAAPALVAAALHHPSPTQHAMMSVSPTPPDLLLPLFPVVKQASHGRSAGIALHTLASARRQRFAPCSRRIPRSRLTASASGRARSRPHATPRPGRLGRRLCPCSPRAVPLGLCGLFVLFAWWPCSPGRRLAAELLLVACAQRPFL